jgi:hypothetical protein
MPSIAMPSAEDVAIAFAVIGLLLGLITLLLSRLGR